jgi:hypothetical protein
MIKRGGMKFNTFTSMVTSYDSSVSRRLSVLVYSDRCIFFCFAATWDQIKDKTNDRSWSKKLARRCEVFLGPRGSVQPSDTDALSFDCVIDYIGRPTISPSVSKTARVLCRNSNVLGKVQGIPDNDQMAKL